MGKFKRKHVQKSLNKVFSKFERLWEAASADYANHVKSRLLEYILPSKNLQTLFSSINFSWVPFYLFFFIHLIWEFHKETICPDNAFDFIHVVNEVQIKNLTVVRYHIFRKRNIFKLGADFVKRREIFKWNELICKFYLAKHFVFHDWE